MWFVFSIQVHPVKICTYYSGIRISNSITEPIIIQTGTGTDAGDFPDGTVAQPQNTSNKWEINNVQFKL